MADETILIDIEFESNAAQEEQQIDDLTASIEGLKVAQSQLDEEVKRGSKTQVEASKQKAKISTQLQTENKQRKDLIKIVQAETGSRDKMRLGISKLIKERDSLNTNTVEGKKRSEELRVKIDELTKAQKESGVQVQAQTANIGNYGDSLKGASTQTGNLSGANNTFNKSSDGFIGGMKGMIKSSLAFIATPLGAVIAAIVVVFKALQKAFQRSEGSMNKVRVITGKLSGVFNLLIKGLEPVVNFILDNVIATFEALGKAVDATMAFVSRALGRLGFDQAAESVDNFNKKLKESSAAGEALADAQNKLNDALRFSEKIQLDFQKLAERQRQIRDDEAISIEERIKANEELSEVLKKQMGAELALANQALMVANMRIKLEGDSTAALDERAEALTKISEIQERVEAQASEQLVNTNSLIREQTALKTAASDKLKEEKQAESEFLQEITDFERELELEQEEEQNALKLEIQAEQDAAVLEMNTDLEDQKTKLVEDGEANRRAAIGASLSAIGQLSGQANALLQQQNQNRLSNDLAALNAKEQSALAIAGTNEAKRAQIEATFQKKRERLEKDAAKKAKKLAITMAIIRGALVILNALNTAPFIPVGVIAAAAAAVVTGFQIAAIKNAKMEKGGQVPLAKKGASFGTFNGPSHASGGIDLFTGSGKHVANVEGNENFYVINKKASDHLNGLSDINQRIGGGVPLNGTATKMARGGQANVETAQPGIDINDITRQVVDRLPPIIVMTKDIKTGLEDRNEVVNVGVI